MLFIFRQLRRSFFLPGKVRTYLAYAVGEIVLIVVGILIALQINNWNEERKTKEQEKLILAEIHEEFLYNKEEWNQGFPEYVNARTNLNTLIAAFPLDLETIDLDDLAETMDGIHVRRVYDGTTSSINKLKSASFDILSNEELRTLLLKFEMEIMDFKSKQAAASKFMDETFRPIMGAKLPRPHYQGFKDPRVDLDFLESLQFESLIKIRRRDVSVMVMFGERNIAKMMDRIIELSKPEE